jgi:glycosyltransferase involved in cell wall biosynthesis
MLLSIVIPSYNHAQFVVSTIQAAARINVQDKEVIVIDDGSSDASVSVIREYIASRGTDHNIRLITRENRGLVRTLNEGLAMAKGKYFYAVASDDIPIPEGICRLVKHLESSRDLQFVLGNALLMDSEYQHEFTTAYGEAHRRFFALPFGRRNKEMFLDYPHPMLLQASVFKTSTLKDIKGWREDIISDDFSLFLRLLSQHKDEGKDFAFQPDVMTCFYRRHGANVSLNLERQFMTIDQALTQLCPTEWRDKAYLRNFADLGIMALKKREISAALRLFQFTFAHMGLLRCLRAAGPAFKDSLKKRISQRLSHNIVIMHEQAALKDSPHE